MQKNKGKPSKSYLADTAVRSLKSFMLLYLFSILLLVMIFLTVRVHYIVILACALSLCLFGLNLIALYRRLYLPFKKTEQSLQSYNLGYNSNALQEIQVYYTEEMEKTFAKFFSLFQSMNAIKLTNTHAEYRALQNQINPHFLYNTLEAIRSDALCEGAENIADITEALATFFRYTISNVNSMVTLEAEIRNAENYFAIQNYRFGERISLKINLDEEDASILEYKLPKLTLQPLIENGILHGLEHKLGRGTIEIDIFTTEDRLMIKVTDDGVGMEESVLEEINKRLHQITAEGLHKDSAQKGGIALINVSNRIKLQFGEKYGLRLYSIKDFGTSAEVTLPLIKETAGVL